MIALVICSAWPKYYAASPYNNLLTAKHPDYVVLSVLPHDVCTEEFQRTVNACEALVVDDVLAPHMSFYTSGPKFMIGGDPHAHTLQKANQLEVEYASVDYVLTGAVFSKKLPQYHYPREETRAKHLYFPHTVPDENVYGLSWEHRRDRALLSGSNSQQVYPFRWENRYALGVDLIPPMALSRTDFFHLIGTYCAAVTCNSIFEYTVAKYFEIPWMGAILLAPKISDAEAELIGFKDAENVWWCRNRTDITNAVIALGLSPLARGIALNGQDLMRARHTVQARLNYLKAVIGLIKAGGFKPDDALAVFKEKSHV